MLHEYLYSLIWVICFVMPAFVILVVRKHYLDENQHHLLMIGCFLSTLYVFNGGIMQIGRLIIISVYVLIVLDITVGELSQFEIFSKKQQQNIKERSHMFGKAVTLITKYYKKIILLKFQETFIIALVIGLWLFLKAYFTQLYGFGVGQTLYDGTIFQGFLKTYNAWNCNFTQYTFLPFVLLATLLLCRFILSTYHEYKVTVSANTDINKQSYSYYLLKYIINPSILIEFIEFFYNLVSHINSEGLFECYRFWKYGCVIQLVYHWSIPLVILYFFYVKSGEFQVQSSSRSSSVNSSESVYSDDITTKQQRLLEWQMQIVG